MKITDTNFRLPIVEALVGGQRFATGETAPMLIRGVRLDTHDKADYVVKFNGARRMTQLSECCELVGACIAIQLGLDIPEPALVNISPDFVETLRGKDGYKEASNSVGLNFGCGYLPPPGFMEFVRNQVLNDEQVEAAQRLYFFDILIANADRRVDKQNMLTDGKRILVFDHELAFGFVHDLFPNPTPWILTDADAGWIKNHYFYRLMREIEPDFGQLTEDLDLLDGEFWDKVFDLIPSEWRTPDVDQKLTRIRTVIESIALHRDEFVNGIYRQLQ